MKKVTREEAIELLKPSGTKDQTYYEKKFDAACEIAVKDMEKQIPKKPAVNMAEYGVCPTCGRSIDTDCCIYCGQRIDWSEED